MILIGSKAIKHHYPDFKREPKDTDYAVPNSEFFSRDRSIEMLVNPVLFKYTEYGEDILSPDNLVTLKASHLCWDINWQKHMFDTQFLLGKGCKIKTDMFWDLYNYWNEYHKKNTRSDLKMTKESFFSNAINYDEMEHDKLHLLINPIPMYSRILKDDCEVELDEDKYLKLSHEDKLDLVREEVMIMAYERFKKFRYRN